MFDRTSGAIGSAAKSTRLFEGHFIPTVRSTGKVALRHIDNSLAISFQSGREFDGVTRETVYTISLASTRRW
jgi:hypothetical protein